MAPLEEERPIKEGDFAEISFSGTWPDTEEAPITAEKAMCEVGGRTTLKEFTENLDGAQVNEEQTFTVTYRPDIRKSGWPGRAVEYKVKVKRLRKRSSGINDEFAQGLRRIQNAGRTEGEDPCDIEKHKQEHAKEQMREKTPEWLEDNNEFEVPDSLVERQLQTAQRLIRDLVATGYQSSAAGCGLGKDSGGSAEQAIRDVNRSLILELHCGEGKNRRHGRRNRSGNRKDCEPKRNRPKEKVREVLKSGVRDCDDFESQIRNKKDFGLSSRESSSIQPAMSGVRRTQTLTQYALV